MSSLKSLLSISRIVKLSSPNLNYLIIMGAALLYAGIFSDLYTIDDEVLKAVLCNVGLNNSILFQFLVYQHISYYYALCILYR